MVSWICVHCSMFNCVLNSVLAFLGKFSEHLFSLVFHNCKDSVYNSFSLPSLFPLTCRQCDGCLLSSLVRYAMGAHGRVARIC